MKRTMHPQHVVNSAGARRNLWAWLAIAKGMSDRELAEKLFPDAPGKATFKMPDYAHVHREMWRHSGYAHAAVDGIL